MNTIRKHDKEFKKFLRMAHRGFVKGAKAYGEGANKKMNLIVEMQEELVDFAGYAFFQFKKLERLKRQYECLIRRKKK